MFDDENLESLISEVFDNLNDNYNYNEDYANYIKNRAILTLKNDDVDDINEKLLIFFLEKLKNFYQQIQ